MYWYCFSITKPFHRLSRPFFSCTGHVTCQIWLRLKIHENHFRWTKVTKQLIWEVEISRIWLLGTLPRNNMVKSLPNKDKSNFRTLHCNIAKTVSETNVKTYAQFHSKEICKNKTAKKPMDVDINWLKVNWRKLRDSGDDVSSVSHSPLLTLVLFAHRINNGLFLLYYSMYAVSPCCHRKSNYLVTFGWCITFGWKF